MMNDQRVQIIDEPFQCVSDIGDEDKDADVR
uniref:Uncharacterized protein n=1 Tax=Romanomermis culicivorax TaxID=13658 RepID=A0A915JC70_ROMCU